MIFIMLSGVTFTRKATIDQTKEFVEKRDSCWEISTKLNSLTTMGNGFSTEFKTIYYASVSGDGLIIVGDKDTDTSDPKEVEAHCNYVGILKDGDLTGLNGKYLATKVNGTIEIKPI